MHFPTDRRAHTAAFDGPVVDHWLEQKKDQTENVSTMQDKSSMQEDPNRYSRMLYRLSYVPPHNCTSSLSNILLHKRHTYYLEDGE